MRKFVSILAVGVMLFGAAPVINSASKYSYDTVAAQAQGTKVTAVKFTRTGAVIKNHSAVKEVTEDGVYLTVGGVKGKAFSSDRSGYTYMVILKNGTWYFD